MIGLVADKGDERKNGAALAKRELFEEESEPRMGRRGSIIIVPIIVVIIALLMLMLFLVVLIKVFKRSKVGEQIFPLFLPLDLH